MMGPRSPDEDWFADDVALRTLLPLFTSPEALKAAEPRLAALGRLAPRELDALGREADRKRPVLAPGAGPGGQDTARYDASYRTLQRLAREHRVFTLSWHPLGEAARAPRTLHFALGYLFAQAEAGYYCPGCMTDGAAWVLDRHASAGLRDWTVPRLVQDAPEGAWEGAMLLTERAGGSDVGQTATQAEPNADGTFALHGEKWFASNCTAEVILTLARLPGAPAGTDGLGLFLVPRFLPPAGEPNHGIRLRSLKDKLGVTSMATAELEFQGTTAFLLAPPGRGFKAMAEMVNMSRLYNAVASVAGTRRALREGVRNGRVRSAFGKPLEEQPLYRLACVRLAVEAEGALAVVLEAARAMDADERDLLRALTPLAKACTAKLAVRAASEACEMLGGNGYVEQWVTPRLLRDAQVLPIWEGTTNIQALDVLRLARKDGLAALHARAQALLAQAQPALAADLAHAWRGLAEEMLATSREPPELQESAALRLLEQHYHAFAATLLAWAAARASPDQRARSTAVAEAYAALLVAPAGIAGQRALERIAVSHGRRILGRDQPI
ncbi:MAG: acyl-CoA dehydrogenase family protein [Halobacteriales archaeon]|nr:acyl-CoA dehydrogenase family protein [Halobacteriales archaeon]